MWTLNTWHKKIGHYVTLLNNGSSFAFISSFTYCICIHQFLSSWSALEHAQLHILDLCEWTIDSSVLIDSHRIKNTNNTNCGANVPSVTRACPVRYPGIWSLQKLWLTFSLSANDFLKDEYLGNEWKKLLWSCHFNFREYPACGMTTGNSCPRSVPSVTDTSGTT